MKKRPRSITTPEEKPRVTRVDLARSSLLRVVLLALLAVFASIYGVVRHFTHPYKSMLVPAEDRELEILWDTEEDAGE